MENVSGTICVATARRLKDSTYLVEPVVNAYLDKELSKAEHRLYDDLGLIFFTPQAIDKFWSRHLYSKFYGIKL